MKKKFLGILAAIAVISMAGFMDFSYATETSSKINAYYFHGNFRCPTCRNMEQYSKEAIETNFKDALASGQLNFQAVNVESKENEHFVNDYRLYTKALVLSMEQNGREIRRKNLDKIWEYARNKERFENYVRDEVAAFMKES